MNRHQATDTGRYLLAMEDMGDHESSRSNVQSRWGEFVAVLRGLHTHTSFREAARLSGRLAGEDSPTSWIGAECERLQRIAPGCISSKARHGTDHAPAILAAGHGDPHCGNWRLREGRPSLIDGEEIRIWPLASELAEFIVFADLDPRGGARRYWAPECTKPAIELGVAASALSFYLHWLRTPLDGSDPRPIDLATAERAGERLLSDGNEEVTDGRELSA